MLQKFQDQNKKIVFDMLSLLPAMNQITRLNQTVEWYREAQDRILYLWKRQSNNWQGLIGIEKKSQLLVIRQLVLVPELTNRTQSYFLMLDDLKRLYPKSYFMGDFKTTAICQAWERSH